MSASGAILDCSVPQRFWEQSVPTGPSASGSSRILGRRRGHRRGKQNAPKLNDRRPASQIRLSCQHGDCSVCHGTSSI